MKMPAKSSKQYKFMAMIANNAAKAKGLGIPQSVGKEMVEKTPSKKRSLFMKG